jgi:hypothetical protein
MAAEAPLKKGPAPPVLPPPASQPLASVPEEPLPAPSPAAPHAGPRLAKAATESPTCAGPVTIKLPELSYKSLDLANSKEEEKKPLSLWDTICLDANISKNFHLRPLKGNLKRVPGLRKYANTVFESGGIGSLNQLVAIYYLCERDVSKFETWLHNNCRIPFREAKTCATALHEKISTSDLYKKSKCVCADCG